MPELPEVENMKMALAKYEGYLIEKIITSNKDLRYPLDREVIQYIRNLKIIKVSRIAKYVVIFLQKEIVLIFHAGMSGKFVIEDTGNHKIEKHDHICIFCSDRIIIKYNDPRRFGAFIVSNKEKYLELPFFQDIAIDALDENFDANYLIKKLEKVSSNIKNTLLNQKIVAGIGNIYASESLFYAKIHPTRKANSLSLKELETLILFIKKILKKSIEVGGSSLKDYKKPSGEKGGFQDIFAVYNKVGSNCINIGCSGEIEKIILNQRASFYCPVCQK